MAEINLPQSEADALLRMEKHRLNDDHMDFPVTWSLTISLKSPDQREEFHLDISRSHINLEKIKYQNRSRHIVILARLDLFGAPHRNPDDGEVPCPHLHVYREGYGDKWALSPPREFFPNLSDPRKTLDDFMRYCNITKPPLFRSGLPL